MNAWSRLGRSYIPPLLCNYYSKWTGNENIVVKKYANFALFISNDYLRPAKGKQYMGYISHQQTEITHIFHDVIWYTLNYPIKGTISMRWSKLVPPMRNITKSLMNIPREDQNLSLSTTWWYLNVWKIGYQVVDKETLRYHPFFNAGKPSCLAVNIYSSHVSFETIVCVCSIILKLWWIDDGIKSDIKIMNHSFPDLIKWYEVIKEMKHSTEISESTCTHLNVKIMADSKTPTCATKIKLDKLCKIAFLFLRKQFIMYRFLCCLLIYGCLFFLFFNIQESPRQKGPNFWMIANWILTIIL